MSDALPILNTAQDCARLAKRLGTGPVVALWATGQPRSTVDVMLQFRELLQQRKFKVVLLLRKSAVQNFSGLFSKINDDLVYEFNNNTLLEHCYFFSVLFTHDYCLSGKPKNFSGKIVFFPHNINCMYPTPRDVFADYVVAVNESYRKFDFSTYPNYIKINKNLIIPLFLQATRNLICSYPVVKRLERGPISAWLLYPLCQIIGEKRTQASFLRRIPSSFRLSVNIFLSMNLLFGLTPRIEILRSFVNSARNFPRSRAFALALKRTTQPIFFLAIFCSPIIPRWRGIFAMQRCGR